MMSIFGTPFCYTPVASQPSLTPLFRLLDEFDSYGRELELDRHTQAQEQRRQQRRVAAPTFKPKFDARETENAYELHGELPGISRENLNIEFTDPQTLIVRGRVVRTYEAKPDAETQTEAEKQPEAQPEPEPVSEKPVNNHHATVEDDPEDDSISIISATSSTSAARAATPIETASSKTASPKTEVAKPAPVSTPAAPAQKVLMYERTVGEFSRTFQFPTRVDQEAVTAALDNGVLSVVVPKAKNVTRKILIN